MTAEELYEKLKKIQKMKCESQTLELKTAKDGCPKRLYDTLSSFSNQDDGGTIIFGIDEKRIIKKPEFMMRRISKRKLTSNVCKCSQLSDRY